MWGTSLRRNGGLGKDIYTCGERVRTKKGGSEVEMSQHRGEEWTRGGRV